MLKLKIQLLVAALSLFGLIVPCTGNETLTTTDDGEASASLPQGHNGIAARYVGDVGIERDPQVIFVEMFEQPTLSALWERWESVAGEQTMSYDDETPGHSHGSQSLLIDRIEGRAGSLYRRLLREDGQRGYDQLYLRYYVKFDPDCGAIHHGVSTMGGYHPPTRWPQGGAGRRPDGAKGFWSSIEPYGNAWTWDYYTYWSQMRGSPPAGQTWGNSFIRDADLAVDKGRWICIEHMIKLNDVGNSNGEQALWIDGKQVSHVGQGFPRGVWIWDKFHPGRGGQGFRWGEQGRERFEVPRGGEPFEGFVWRTSEQLDINFIRLYLYTERPAGHRMRVWLDHVVVATAYIGPLHADDEVK